MTPSGRPVRPAFRTAFWLACVAVAFAMTHTPRPGNLHGLLRHDTLAHLVGYTGLGLVTIWRIAGGARPGMREVACWAAGLIAYGLFDEATQPLVGRSFEWTDWAADLSGAIVGTLGATAWYRWWSK